MSTPTVSVAKDFRKRFQIHFHTQLSTQREKNTTCNGILSENVLQRQDSFCLFPGENGGSF
jgi:hypothetical protein